MDHLKGAHTLISLSLPTSKVILPFIKQNHLFLKPGHEEVPMLLDTKPSVGDLVHPQKHAETNQTHQSFVAQVASRSGCSDSAAGPRWSVGSHPAEIDPHLAERTTSCLAFKGILPASVPVFMV